MGIDRRISPEEIAARKANLAGLRDSSFAADGHFLSNWHADEEKSKIEVAIQTHPSAPISTLHWHTYWEVIEVAEKDDKPARTFKVLRRFRCWEKESWQKHLRMKKEQPCAPKCPVEILVNHVRDRKDLHDRALFRIDGVTGKDGKALEALETTGAELCGMVDTRNGRMKAFNAQQKRILLVIPFRLNDKLLEPFEVKIALESWGLGSKIVTVMDDAIEEYGDRANPAVGPAIYRWNYDDTEKMPANKYRVTFRQDVEVPDEFWQLWAAKVSDGVVEAYHATLKPGSGRKLLAALEAQLVPDIDLDLAAVMKIDPTASEDDAEAEEKRPAAREEKREEKAPPATAKASSSAAKPKAEKAAEPKEEKKARRAVVEEERKIDPLPPGEPCPKCQEFWPDGRRYCPGRFTDKKCRAFDANISEADGAKEGPAPKASNECPIPD